MFLLKTPTMPAAVTERVSYFYVLVKKIYIYFMSGLYLKFLNFGNKILRTSVKFELFVYKVMHKFGLN